VPLVRVLCSDSEASINVVRKRAEAGLLVPPLPAAYSDSETGINVLLLKRAEAGLLITFTLPCSGAGACLFPASAEAGLSIPMVTSEADFGANLESGEAGLILTGSLFLSAEEGRLAGGDALIGWLPKWRDVIGTEVWPTI
jgi:hypothetical protein